ncbi:MAG: fibrobacter succinogenes major paralogous domain-containing protein, partial [Crocinitomicaceae bacterium]|nr:fibrobacter succinogenes major paralogous domain-containing protein [Crocinitomicaceae bacterium]
TCTNCNSWNAEYRRKKECNVCKDTRLVSGKTNSGNGSNSSGFSGLPGGRRNYGGDFDNIGSYGPYWSVSESYGPYAWSRELGTNFSDLGHNDAGYSKGFSVRCVKD